MPQLTPDQKHYQLALLFQYQGQLDQATGELYQALELNPHHIKAHNLLGILLAGRNQLQQAAVHFREALSLAPNDLQATNNLANILAQLHQYEPAINLYRQLLQKFPHQAQVHTNLATCLVGTHHYSEAISYLHTSLRLKPHQREAYYQLAVSLIHTQKLSQALRHTQTGLQYFPDDTNLLSLHINCRQHLCVWDNLDQLNQQLNRLVSLRLSRRQHPGEVPFISIARTQDIVYSNRLARFYSAQAAELAQQTYLQFAPPPPHNLPLKIGFLSDGFRDYPTTHNLVGLISLLDRSRFQVHLLSLASPEDTYYQHRIYRAADQVHLLRDLNFTDSARLIADLKLDIVVDVKGHSGNNRLPILAFRTAPVQLALLGFPGGIEANFIDYNIFDPIVAPPKDRSLYHESHVYLPHSYFPTDNTPPSADKPVTRTDFGLPQNQFIFASFNKTYKIEPEVFQVWLRLLQQTPDSVLWLLCSNRQARNHLRTTAGKVGINPQRLIFTGTLPKPDHLARLSLADLALDTFTVNGHTTSVDYLWAAVPLVTLPGDHVASRVSASLLIALGVPELITHSLDDYFALSLHLATHPKKLQRIKLKIESCKSGTHQYPLFATTRFAQNQATAYLLAYDRFLQGQPHSSFSITDPLPLKTEPSSSHLLDV